jgi:hypothetical protein
MASSSSSSSSSRVDRTAGSCLPSSPALSTHSEFIDTEHERKKTSTEESHQESDASSDEGPLQPTESVWALEISRSKPQCNPHAQQPLILHIAKYFSDPRRWCNVWDQLPCLEPVQNEAAWLTNEIMDWYILSQFRSVLGSQKMPYIPIDLIQALQSNRFIVDPHIQGHFERVCQLQKYHMPLKKQVAFMVCHHNHWFAVAFDVKRQMAWTFNRTPHHSSAQGVVEVDDDWEAWDGPDLWKAIAILLKWTTKEGTSPAPPTRAKGLSWYGVRAMLML